VPRAGAKHAPRKLLVAAVGVATITHVAACGKKDVPTAANLAQPFEYDANGITSAAPLQEDASPQPVSADAATPDAGSRPATPDAGKRIKIPPTSGNLPAPRDRDGF
jgi:hypothetical protein